MYTDAQNAEDVLRQMEMAGIVLRQKDLDGFPKRLGKRVTCGQGGKHWYTLNEFRPDAGGVYLVGRYGSYRTGSSDKVENDWSRLSDAERERMQAERRAAAEKAKRIREEEAAEAALTAAEMWRRGSAEGTSPYLVRKGFADGRGESCRYLPDGSLLVPLIRYDLPRAEALRGVQRIYGGPRKDSRTGEALPDKVFTKNFEKPGCAVRLGEAAQVLCADLLLVCEGYATGLSLRAATEWAVPVFVALDAGNLGAVVPLVAGLYPDKRILICADDDWRTRDHAGVLNNPGRTKAKAVAKATPRCDLVYPVFDPATRQVKDTDFNDLHARQGLDAVRDQLGAVMQAIKHKHG